MWVSIASDAACAAALQQALDDYGVVDTDALQAVLETKKFSSPSVYKVRNAASPGPDRPCRTRLRPARTLPDVLRGTVVRDRTPDANAAPIAPDLLWFGAAHAKIWAWQGPPIGHFARRRPARLSIQRPSACFPPVQTEHP